MSRSSPFSHALKIGVLLVSVAPIGAEAATRQSTGQDSFAAVAWAEGYRNLIWSSGYPSKETAESAALKFCNERIGKDCTIAAHSRNGFIVVGIADDGGRIVQSGRTRVEAADIAINRCRSEGSGARCTIQYLDLMQGSPQVKDMQISARLPDQWATFAYRSNAYPGDVRRVWPVAQQPSQEEAIRKALLLCTREEKRECTAKAGVRNVRIAVYTALNEPGTPMIESDIDDARLEAAVEARCKLMAANCITFGTFSASEPVWQAINLAAPAPAAPPSR